MRREILCFLFAIFTIAYGCKFQDMVQPCTCTDSPVANQYNVTCGGLNNERDLLFYSKYQTSFMTVYSFTLENSVVSYIPSTAFSGMKLQNLIIKDSSFNALTDADDAFVGLEVTLNKIMVSNCIILGDWDWSVFSKLKKLKRMHITDGNIETIEKAEFMRPLKMLNLGNNNIYYIDDQAFERMPFLVYLILDNNRITTLKRSMFPSSASLLTLSLRYNKIARLPPDMFTGMDMLRMLDVSFNEILTLEKKLLEPIWMNLLSFEAKGNELRCDCRLKWIANTNSLLHPSTVQVFCSLPPNLQGRHLLTLESNELQC